MKRLIKILIVIVMISSIVSCKNDSRPNYQYMPNMYVPISYETYGESDAFSNGVEAQLPVEGTIPRGWKPYEYENTNDGYLKAKEELKNPLAYNEENLNNGKALYDIYCAICHGNKGDGQGKLVKREKILGIPTYNDVGRAITEGSIYHVMYYGRNAMGSYAVQVNETERWQIDHYVIDLKNKLDGLPKRAFQSDNRTQEEAVTLVEEVTESIGEH